MYTLFMFTSHPITFATFQPNVVLDCSEVSLSDTDEKGSELSKLIDWVQTFPKRNAVHVFLRMSIRDRSARTMRNTLQALGCRVTARSSFGSVGSC